MLPPDTCLSFSLSGSGGKGNVLSVSRFLLHNSQSSGEEKGIFQLAGQKLISQITLQNNGIPLI